MEQEIRLHKFYHFDRKSAAKLFKQFDKGITVDEAIPIHSGMSTSNYCIVSGQKKYLLKIYSGDTGNIEPTMYNYLRDYICTPTLLYYDDTKMLCPHSYAIIEYIDGETFLEYVKRSQAYPIEKVYKISEMLSIIHEKTYANSGLLDKELQIVKPVKSTKELILDNLAGKAGMHLSGNCREKLATYLEKNKEFINRIDQNYVLCHGDLGYGNILISNEKVYFIDFEYALAESRYRDIGKFFRNKTPEIQKYIDEKTYNAFLEGYTSAGNLLSEDWLQLARFADIPVMLGLLNIDNPPVDWITDIENDIMVAIL
jgi:tRNA A-37 threonylcarbamoyl transferase component Bud32